MKVFKNNIEVRTTNATEQEEGTLHFAEPLAITDASRQWNNTAYDVQSLDISSYDGTVTADHGQNISDVIGKVQNLRKDGDRVVIDGIKFATKENPLAVLAKNLMKGGFVTGVSIETMGDDPDTDMVWRNHALCGLSIVAHPNNKNAYAVVANSIAEATNAGLDGGEILDMVTVENKKKDDDEDPVEDTEEESPAEEDESDTTAEPEAETEIEEPDDEPDTEEPEDKDDEEERRKRKNRIEELHSATDELLEKILNGGKGSGNFGHSGRPGKVGGSGGGHGSSKTSTSESKGSESSSKSSGSGYNYGGNAKRKAKAEANLEKYMKKDKYPSQHDLNFLKQVAESKGEMQKAFSEDFNDIDASTGDGNFDFAGPAYAVSKFLVHTYPKSKVQLEKMRKQAHQLIEYDPRKDLENEYDERDFSSKADWEKYMDRIDEANDVLHAAIDSYCDGYLPYLKDRGKA